MTDTQILIVVVILSGVYLSSKLRDIATTLKEQMKLLEGLATKSNIKDVENAINSVESSISEVDRSISTISDSVSAIEHTVVPTPPEFLEP